MFEPACRGGSKRSLNISSPTPKWPRSPGEMVSAPARAADTHTHSHSHSRTPGPTHTRLAPAPTSPPPPPPPPRPCSPFWLGVFFLFLFLFKFQFAFAGLPPAPRKANTSPGRIFPESLGPPGGGKRACRPCSCALVFRGAEPGTRRVGAGARVCGGVRVWAKAVRARRNGVPRFPHPGPRAGLCRPGPAAGCGKEVYLALRAELRAWGSCLCRSVPMITLHLGQRRGMVCLWGFRAARRWGPVSGRRRLTRCGRGRGGDYSWRLVAPETVRAGRVWLPKFIPAPFLPTQAVTPCPQKPLDSVCATENRGTPYES